MVEFLLNGAQVSGTDAPVTRTLLDWLREGRGLTGTKEAWRESDRGACTVIVIDARGPRALTPCILCLPQPQGTAVRTVEGLGGPDGALHPMQQAMIEHHGSQCGYCTPGFVVSMAVAHANGATDWNDQLAGNLCRCTGYAPILRAARAAADAPVPGWVATDRAAVQGQGAEASPPATAVQTATGAATTPPAGSTEAEPASGAPPATGIPAGPAAAGGPTASSAAPDAAAPVVQPDGADDLAAWYLDHPDATLVAGATDVGLWITKQFRDLGPVPFLNRCADLRGIAVDAQEIRIGAMTTLTDLLPVMAEHHPDFAELIRRYGSVQVRNAATLGGNIANGSPIGDSPPTLIALGATLHLRRGDARRSMAWEDFFLDYGTQDRQPGEFVEAVSLPRQADNLACYKLSKRVEQGISPVCGCFNIRVEDETVAEAHIAFGGMAAVPKRAAAVERALLGQPWSEATVSAAMDRFAEDFAPLSDMPASAGYRLATARNMLRRLWLERSGPAMRVLAVRP